jgi:ribosomal protein L37AE/L43A
VKKNRVDQKEYKMRNTQGCMYCGKWVVVPKCHTGFVYCSVCGEDGTNRKKEYVERG